MNHQDAFDRVPPIDAASTAARLPERPLEVPVSGTAARARAADTARSIDVAELWERVRQSLQERIRPEQFHTWFEQAELRAIGVDGLVVQGALAALPNTVQLAVQNNFTSFFIKTYYMEQLVDALGEACGGNPAIEIVVDGRLTRGTVADRHVRELQERSTERSSEHRSERSDQKAQGGVSRLEGNRRPGQRDLFDGSDEHDGDERDGSSLEHTNDSRNARTNDWRGPGSTYGSSPNGASRNNGFASDGESRFGEQRPTPLRTGDARPQGGRANDERDTHDTDGGVPSSGATRSAPIGAREEVRAGEPRNDLSRHDSTPRNDRTALGRTSAGAAQQRPNAPRGGEFGAPEHPRGRLLSSSDVGLNPSYRFDAFVVGPCNRFAHAAAVGVSEQPGLHYNPLFLHGNVGLGKTHLIQSLCHAILARDPGTRILYLSCESFVNHFIDALDKGDLQRFRNKYRNVDVLVVDDIHLLANKERTQEEFFHTFNTLYNAGKQIVLSSDSPPKDIPTLQSRLVSRFKWGLVTEIESPCYETRRAILKRKSREKGNELPDDVASDLAEAITANIRELEGAVTRLLGYAALSNQPVSVSLARECLRDLFEHATSQPTIEDVLRVVTSHFQIRLVDLQSRKRTSAIAFARQVGMFLARKLTRLSLQEIGGHFGGRDHSTVLYAVERIKEGTQKDAEILETVRRLEAALSMH
jgi:chromosomal replication initiator protein